MRLNELFDNGAILITEGGNLELPGGHRAHHIDLKAHDRGYIVPVLMRLMTSINSAFAKAYKKPLWSPELLKSRQFLSGSSLHFFNTNISDEEFVKVKPKVGDIDTQVNRDLSGELDEFLQKIKGKHIGNATFLGYERGNEQFSSLWELDDLPLKIQIDLEFVPFEGGKPSDWAQFSHSSAWEDIQAGIKGVFHKYLIQSFATLTKQDFLLRKMVGRGKARAEQDVPTTDNMISFAVSSKEGGGLRQKYEPVLDAAGEPLIKDGLPVLRARPTEGYDQSLFGIFSKMFGVKLPEKRFEALSKKFWSFTGLLDVMNQLLDDDEKRRVVESFIDKLFDPGAQGLYKNDPDRDIQEKSIALNKMLEFLRVAPPTNLAQRIAAYKESYRMTEGLLEAKTDYKRVGIKHIHNPGSSTEMKDQEFLDMVDEIHANGDTLDGFPINLKVDGAGIRIGRDESGKPFMMTSKVTKPLYKENVGDFRRYAEDRGGTPEQVERAAKYDDALRTILDAPLMDALPKDSIVQAEMLDNAMAEETPEGLRFVNIPYDPRRLGTRMTLVPFSFRVFSTGEPLPDASRVKRELIARSSPTIKIMSNRLKQKGINVAREIAPVINMRPELKAALASRKKDDPLRAEAREILTAARKALSDAIIKHGGLEGKDQLGEYMEGLVINFPSGILAKVTSPEMKAKMAAKLAAPKPQSTTKRTRTAVVTAGSFAGHKGHEQLVNMVLDKAREVGGDPYVYISSKVGPDDPFPPQVKLETWRRLYPGHKSMFHLIVSPDGVTSPSPIKKIEKELVLPANSPYKRIILMVGADRYEGFKKWMDKLEQRMKDPAALAKYGGTQDQVDFETIRTGRSADEGGTGMSFTQLRNILKDPNATEEQKLDLWCKGFDERKLGRDYIKHLMRVAERGMGLKAPSEKLGESKPWDHPAPSGGKGLSPKQRTAARARANREGRPYPNWIDNAWASKRSTTESQVCRMLEVLGQHHAIALMELRGTKTPMGVRLSAEAARRALNRLRDLAAKSTVGENWNRRADEMVAKIRAKNPKLDAIATKYVEFGNAHPTWQTFILGVLSALITVGGIGAGAAGGLAAMSATTIISIVNGLLKGERLTDVAIDTAINADLGRGAAKAASGLKKMVSKVAKK